MKIGLIQMQRFGDLVIALPIAAWFIRQGHEVYWPVFEPYHAAIQAAAPAVNFLPISAAESADKGELLYDLPLARLRALGCAVILPLYSVLGKGDFFDETLKNSLKFDEYKYAYAGVPFAEKWALSLVRDPAREQALYDSLDITRPYICVHRQGVGYGGGCEIARRLARLPDRRNPPADGQSLRLAVHDRTRRQARDDRQPLCQFDRAIEYRGRKLSV